MARIISVSIRTEDEWILDELKQLGGSVSSHVVEAVVRYLKDNGASEGKPFWFVEGKDYSHLPLEDRKKLVKFGYTDAEVS